MNHSQFGTYGGQSGDVPATIDDETARERLTAVLRSWFGNRTARVGWSGDRSAPAVGFRGPELAGPWRAGTK